MVVSERPAATVVIPVRNRLEELQCCLESLNCQDCRDRLEVLVIDDASAGLSVKGLAQKSGARVIRLERRYGAAYAKNLGALTGKSGLVLFLDSDTVLVNQRAVSAMIEVIENHPECGSVGGEAIVGEDQSPVFVFGRNIDLGDGSSRCDYVPVRDAEAAELNRFDYLPTSNCLTRRSLVLALLGFDDAFLDLGSDKDFGFRLHKSGLRSYVTPTTVVDHRFSPSHREGDALYNQCRTQLRFVVRHMGMRQACQLVIPGVQGNRRKPSSPNEYHPLVQAFEEHLRQNVLRLDRSAGLLSFAFPTNRLTMVRAFIWTLLHLKGIRREGSIRLRRQFIASAL
jgi:GT2 family glycosyltransferase